MLAYTVRIINSTSAKIILVPTLGLNFGSKILEQSFKYFGSRLLFFGTSTEMTWAITRHTTSSHKLKDEWRLRHTTSSFKAPQDYVVQFARCKGAANIERSQEPWAGSLVSSYTHTKQGSDWSAKQRNKYYHMPRW